MTSTNHSGEGESVGLRSWVKRLERETAEGAVLIRGRDGSVRVFDRMHVMGQMYLAQVDDALGRPRHSSDVLDALEGATPESCHAMEEMSSGSFYADLESREATEAAPDDLSE
jgi:hypothetical protein